MREIVERAGKLLAEGTVNRVLGWRRGELPAQREPAFFESQEALEDLVYDGFCGANLSKFMIEAGKREGKTLVFLKPCDTYSYNQLLKEHRVEREKAYIIGVGCRGKVDADALGRLGMKGILSLREEGDQVKADTLYGERACGFEEALYERCLVCARSTHAVYDELIGQEERPEGKPSGRFEKVEELEAMSPAERFAFWQGELSRCIRCNACRNVCPACSCRHCVFDSDRYDTAQKANSDPFEEQMFHIIRAFHVAGRCTDCGECSRVCPQKIPLHLLNRKLIKDINTFYGEYQAGADGQARGPLTSFEMDDIEPGQAGERG